MVWKIAASFMVAGAFLLVGPSVSALDPWDETEDEQMTASDIDTVVEGKVVNVDPETRNLAVEGREDGEIYDFFANDETTFTTAGLSEIKPGDKARVDYYAYKGRHIAQTITLVETTSGETDGSEPLNIKKVLSD